MVAIGGNVVKIIISATDQASAVITGVKGKLGGLGGAMNKLRGPMLAMGAASVGMAAISVKSFADYETSMAKVNTLLDDGEDATKTYGDTVEKLAEQYGVAGGRMGVAAGLYQTISAGISDTAEATQFLEAATKAAVGGSAELDTVILAGTKTIAAFGLTAEDTEMVMDKFAGTVKAGQTTMSELASAFPRVSGMAGEMGVSLDETLGTLAGLTKIMGSTEEAATGMSAIFTGLLKPTDTMKDTLKDMGFESGQAAIADLGLVGTLQKLKEVSGGDAEAMGELFGNVRALRSIFPMLGAAAEDVAESIDIVSDSAGLSTKQFEDMDNTAGQRMAKLQAKFEGMTVRIGEALMPLLEMMVPIVEKVIEIFSGLSPVIQAGVLVIGALAGVFALLWPVISGIAGAIGGAGGLGAVIAALSGPIGWVVLAVGLLAAAWATNFGGIQDKVFAVWEMIRPIFEKVGALLGRIADILVKTLGPAFNIVLGALGVLFDVWWNVWVKPPLDLLIWTFNLIIDTLDAVLSAFEGDFGPLANVVQGVVEDINGFFSGLIGGMLDFGKNLVKGFIDGILSMGSAVGDAIWGLVPPEVRDFIRGSMAVAGGISQGIGEAWHGLTGLAEGGLVTGPTIAMLGENNKRELVIPLEKLEGFGGRQTTVYIENINVGSDYDVDRFKRRLAEDEEDSWARRQNR